ncbi:M23 family metallopeptidase [Desulforapulum autotrophicum]|nr:M23 family metallopeptidase [Desulforapulum autotrophicum]
MILINKYFHLICIVLLLAASVIFLSSSVGISNIPPISEQNNTLINRGNDSLSESGESGSGMGAFPSDSKGNNLLGCDKSMGQKSMTVTPDIQGEIGRNNTVYGKLISCGLSPTQILNLTQAFEKTFDFRSAGPDDQFQIFFGAENQLDKFIYNPDPLREYIAKRNETGGFTVSRQDAIPEKRVEAMDVILNSSLCQAILDNGEQQCLVDQFVKIFSWDIDFYLFPRKGDRITILYEKYFIDDTFINYGKILAAKYAGQNGTFSCFSFNGGYYDAQGDPLKKRFLRIPVEFGVKTSGYSIKRFHPVQKKYKPHTGIDYGARMGTPIFATAQGKVTYSGWKTGYGKVVILKHSNGYQTYYAHCSKLIAKKGQFVDQGQTIAKVGMTGVATGPHVHYEVRIKGKPVDPMTVKNFKGKPLSPKKLEQFRATVQSRLLLVEEKNHQNSSGTLLVRGDSPE